MSRVVDGTSRRSTASIGQQQAEYQQLAAQHSLHSCSMAGQLGTVPLVLPVAQEVRCGLLLPQAQRGLMHAAFGSAALCARRWWWPERLLRVCLCCVQRQSFQAYLRCYPIPGNPESGAAAARLRALAAAVEAGQQLATRLVSHDELGGLDTEQAAGCPLRPPTCREMSRPDLPPACLSSCAVAGISQQRTYQVGRLGFAQL
jgi:hypothetical protein